ncbi:FMN reductase (NADH) RutF [Mycolicibacterium aubagnense]
MTQTPQIDPRTFRNVLGQFCTGITVITTVHDGVPVGFACQSFAALSLDPPLVLFCPTKQSRAWKAIEASGKFCVNMLHENQQLVSAQFGSRADDKFAGIDWRPSELGSPVLGGTLARTSTAPYIPCTTAATTSWCSARCSRCPNRRPSNPALSCSTAVSTPASNRTRTPRRTGAMIWTRS